MSAIVHSVLSEDTRLTKHTTEITIHLCSTAINMNECFTNVNFLLAFVYLLHDNNDSGILFGLLAAFCKMLYMYVCFYFCVMVATVIV